MSAGRLIAVVGPSGVGKDSLMAALLAQTPGLRRVRRTITRPPEQGGEDYDAVTPQAFEDAVARGAFCLHWHAHGLRYGIPARVLDEVRGGAVCLANLSRGALAEAGAVFPAVQVLHVTASPAVLAQRLAGRGRETPDEVAGRLARSARPLPAGLNVTEIVNDGTLEQAVAAALAAIRPVPA